MTLRSTNEPRLAATAASDFFLAGNQALSQNETTGTSSYVYPLLKESLLAGPCQPPTPNSDLDRYTNDINSHNSRMSGIVNSIPPNGLIMGPFARARNDFANYVNSMPGEFCIGAGNQAAFDRLNAALGAAVSTVQRGNSVFESNLNAYVSRVTPLLNKVYSESIAINANSRDFTAVVFAVQAYNSFAQQYQLEIWNLTQTIANLADQLGRLLQAANGALNQAINQIETNVEAAARTFVDQQRLAEDAFRQWDQVDGKSGFEAYDGILRRVVQVLIPEFNAFLQKVPATDRVKSATARAQQSVNQIDTGYASFPDFSLLPSPSDAFPHGRYGSEERKYGGSAVIAALKSIATAYFNRTKVKLFIGDMQYRHGGKMGIHKSHKNGIDGDVDGIEIGDVPNHKPELALALAKDILLAGARTVFYADPGTVTAANNWAAQNNVSGRLQVEANHTKHFHIRMAE